MTRWTVACQVPLSMGFPGKNTGVGCHFLLQCLKVKSESEVAQLCLNLSDPMDCSLPGSSVHGLMPGKCHRQGSLLTSPWDHKESHIREQLHFSLYHHHNQRNKHTHHLQKFSCVSLWCLMYVHIKIPPNKKARCMISTLVIFSVCHTMIPVKLY